MKDELFTFSIGSLTDSPWVEGTIEATGQPWLETKGRLFYTGRRRGRDYTPQVLDRMAEQFVSPESERDWSVPLQLDHSTSARNTIGSIRKVWRDGNDLFGTVRYVGTEAVTAVKNGTWRKLSISHYPNYRIKEVSVTPFPALVGAETYSESEESMADTATEKTTPTPTAPQATPVTGEPTTSFSEFKAQMEAQFAAKTAEMESRLAKSEQKNQELGQAIRFTQITAEIDKFSEEGKTLPVMRETELALVQTFSEDQMNLWRAHKAATPKLIDERVKGSQDPDEVSEFKQSQSPEGSESVQDRAKRMAARYGHTQPKETA